MARGVAGVAGMTAAIVLYGMGGRPEASGAQSLQIRQVPAARGNYTARSSRTIRRIVIHTVEGSESSCINWFQNPRARVSAHYLVSHAGRITQMVPDMSVAWHATVYNDDSIGIENEGYASRNGWTTAQYTALAGLVRSLCDRHGIPKTRQRIVGHNQVPGSGKVDPGRHFDWDRFLSLVNGGAAPTVQRQPVAQSGLSGVEVTASSLNVRATPGGRVLGQAPSGARFVASAQSGGWTRIAWGGSEGWVSSAFVRRVAGQAEVVTSAGLNVRSGPSAGEAAIGQTAAGRAHFRLGESGDWVLIQFDQRQGWVNGGFTSTTALP